MTIETPEQFKEAADSWDTYEVQSSWIGLDDEQHREQLAIERDMEASPFEFDEDGNVIRKEGR